MTPSERAEPPERAEPWRPWSLRGTVDALRAGRTTPDDVLARAYDRIGVTEPTIRAWVEVDEAASGSGTGPLQGVPFGVKDIIDLAGFPTRCGSRLRLDAAPAAADAAIVTAWRAAGATPLGKTVTTEFAFFAPGPTRNPAAPDHTPGGSSSGSAAAVASGQLPLAIGSQTAGSVTRPAAYCGVASLVMAHGRFPVDGVVGLSPSLDSHGCYAATVDDLALAWSALSGERDVGGGERGAPLRLLLWTARALSDLAPAMEAALARAVDLLRSEGATVDLLPVEELVAGAATAQVSVMRYEAAQERAVELALADQLSDPLAGLLRAGAATPVEEYDAARAVVAAARDRVLDLLDGHDAVIGPAALGAAPAGLAATGDPLLSRPWQAMGLPAVAVPGLHDGRGLPLGVQVVGAAGGETRALAAGCWVERALRAS